LVWRGLVGVVALWLVLGAAPVRADLDATAERLRERAEEMRANGYLELGGSTLTSVDVLPALYEQRDFRAAWTSAAAVQQVVEAIRRSPEDGLEPQDYHLDAIARLLADGAGGRAAATEARTQLDLLLTDALARLVGHLYFGKVDPAAVNPGSNFGRDAGELQPIDALARAIERGNIMSLLDEARPKHPLYAQLRAALAGYRGIADRGGWPSVADGPKLGRGARGSRVAALRQRLAATGDVEEAEAKGITFDEAVEKGVRRFQRRHNLPADGVVGTGTLNALNVPVETRIDQIRINLERARWVLHEVQGEFLLVDVAGFKATYVRDGETRWQSRVQVGTPYRSTPTFKSAITYLVLNPTWTVPPTILGKDILPAARRNPGVIAERNLRLLDRDGRPVDPAQVDWSRYSAGNFPYLLRQDSGPRNALGRIKFMFPNRHMVYLHDTPNKSLFEKPERTFSSGCIRIERPLDLAELLLEGNPRWSRERLERAVGSKVTQTVFVPRPIPVLLLYWTVFFDEEGRIGFKKDIYDRDPAVLAALKEVIRFKARPIV
jgi:murein L,D-transpeptidase YcbB/YkuD